MMNSKNVQTSAPVTPDVKPAAAPRKSACPDWDDEIVIPVRSTTLLPDGIYPFRITRIEKDFYDNPGSKIPPCNRVKLTFRIDGGDAGEVTVRDNFFITENFAWKVADLMQSLGLIAPGEKIKWRQLNEVEGFSGQCEIGTQKYTGRDGKPHQINTIVRYLKKSTCSPKKTFQKGVF